ncbi:MAG: tetratricopeptide repeat protein [Candidatus Poribacteria bacterium]|nr:tetratricopeptide repeat protein [Candidatus Poribacteria bacterium]
MAKVPVRTAVEPLDEMLCQLKIEQLSTASDEPLNTQADIDTLEGLISLIPEIFADVAQKEPLLRLLLAMATTCRRLGDPVRTSKFCQQIIDLTADGGFIYFRATAFRQLGNLKFYEGEWIQAQSHYQQSLDLFESENDRGRAASIHNHLGYIAVQQGDLELAKEHHQQVIDMAGENGEYKRVLAGAYNSLAVIASIQADWDTTINCFEKSITIYEELDLPREAAQVYVNLAMAYADAEEWQAAGECYAEATTLTQASGDLVTLERIYINRAEFLLNLGNISAANLYCNRALSLAQQIGDSISIADVYKLYGRIHRYQEDWGAAINAFTESIQIYQSCQNVLGETESCYEFGLMYKNCQNRSQARYFLQRSGHLYRSLGAVEAINRVENEIVALNN